MLEIRTLEKPLVSNGYPLEMTQQRLGWLVPTDAGLPIARIKEIYREQGYVWLKRFFPREEVLAFRRFFFTVFVETGLLVKDSDPAAGLYGEGIQDEQREAANQAYWEMVRSPVYEAFCKTPRLWQFYRDLLQDEPYLHKRKILRYNVPGEQHCTGGHYDLVYLRAGTDRLYTSWIPLGDVPVEMGGLLYLEGSDRLGRQLEAEFSAKNMDLSPEERISAYNKNMREGGWIGTDLAEMARRFDTRWLMADYEAGDMVIHSPYMIHAATNNADPRGRIRLSSDTRYQAASDQIDQRWGHDLRPNDGL